jgi:DNA primase
MALYPNGGYHCFGCGKHGNNAIDFTIDMGYTFKDALEELKNYL